MRVTVLNLNLCQWGKKGFQLKENKLQNKLKPDINVTHWFLKTFVGIQLLPLLPKLHVLYLLVNAWSERGGSAIQQIKTNKKVH